MRRVALLWAVVGIPLLAGPARAGDLPPFPIDDFLTPPVRKAFAVAARSPELWQEALGNPTGYLASRGIEVPRDLSVAFVEQLRGGDWIGFQRPGEMLTFFCPPERQWWQNCRKVIRVCDEDEVCVDDGQGGCILVKVERNCAFVCEESIFDEHFTLFTRPPFPPLGGPF